ncbi:MAG: NADH-dependent [FeFe] hydrogenase, group A6 [Pirellulales bacterium]|jgi:iron-only hydrogenase group A|nr:NADH-dependent [FeFe] hydrogenase, group A6 [Thermoguttaceae bacterium]MDD4789392.1 NADH-dependent [FeFe] hydrogenase, group A6 [Pirellulales bacterium]NLZ03130.1 4Fe-4S binding protein [Pirellulaceae bacterium]
MVKKTISLTIDEKPISVPAGTTIMEAAERLGITIPRLCYHPDLSLAGSCRVCIVEVEGLDFFMASCSVQVWEGMVVRTNSPEIRQARRDIVELILDNHSKDCQTCERDSNCELQNLAYSMGVRERLFEGKRKQYPIDDSSLSVIRNPEKCVLCGRCVRVCAEIQGVHNLSQHGRGFHTVVGPADLAAMDDSVCIQCGQCINVCPTAAFLEKSNTDAVWSALANPDLHVVVQTAPSIRAAIGEGFGAPPGTPSTGKMITALRLLGFDAVFDTDFGADLTIVEEAHEFLTRLDDGGPLPMITSCSPGWISFMEKFYPALIPHASSCKSPMSMLSTLAKTYYAEQKGIDPARIYMVGVMPCVAKKYEAGRKEHFTPDGVPYTDAVLTTRELIWMIKCYGINFAHLDDGQFDSPLGLASGAGDIFGTTGGVMEATLRAASELVTGKPADRLEFTEVRAVEGLRETYVAIGDRSIHVGVANGLTNAKVLLDKIISGRDHFHVIEVMACPGGCIGGGGQPYPPENVKVLDPELLRRRASALYAIDRGKQLRKSYENPAIQELYDMFLGSPGSEKAHQLLHTHYQARLPRGIR